MDIITFNKDSNILTEKYAPTKIKEIIGSKRQVYAIVDWLKKFRGNAKMNLQKQNNKKKGKKDRRRRNAKTKTKSSTNESDAESLAVSTKKTKKKDPSICSCMIVTGDHGTGKTAIVKAVLNDMEYQMRTVNFQKMGHVKRIDNFIENLLMGDNIYDTIQKNESQKIAIVIDEIESISTPTEKNVITGILRINAEIWGCPVIFIGSNKHKKILTTVKKESYHITIYEPEVDDMLTLLERIGLGEGMKLEENMDIIVKIIEHSQKDYRRLIVTLGELQRLYGSNVVTYEGLMKYLKYSEQKDIDRSIYQHTTKLFSEYDGINTALKVFDNDKTNMPLMVHQNHFLALNRYINNKSRLIELSSEISEGVAHGDIIDNYIYSDQNWNLQEMHGFYTCVFPSYKLNNNIDTKQLAVDAQYPYYNPKFSSIYPKDLNKTSTKCINYKNVKVANEYFDNMTINDYVFACKLIKSLLGDGRAEECKEILNSYELPAHGIMYVLKIDKINGTKKDIAKIIEKKAKEIAIEPVKAAVIKKQKKSNNDFNLSYKHSQ